MLSPHEKRDKIIRATDLDALSCRFQANNKSYFQPSDPYINSLITSYQQHLQYCSGYTNLSSGRTLRSVFNEQKLPLINRGTYLRTRLIDLIINKFIESCPNSQIISLGGGSDTRSFRLMKQYQDKDIKYIEFDFNESVKIKKLAILSDPHLNQQIGGGKRKDTQIEISSKSEFEQFDSDLHTDNYHLMGYDLRQLNPDNDLQQYESILKIIDTSRPTIILSECVLCYLTPQENENILKFWSNLFYQSNSVASFLIYEPMSLNDAFGDTMTQNLSNRGINLHTFDEYPNLEARLKFFKSLGFSNIRLTDISDIGGYSKSSNDNLWIDSIELQRINRLELIDEVEELRLLFKHYCLCYAECPKPPNVNVNTKFNNIDGWNWLLQ